MFKLMQRGARFGLFEFWPDGSNGRHWSKTPVFALKSSPEEVLLYIRRSTKVFYPAIMLQAFQEPILSHETALEI